MEEHHVIFTHQQSRFTRITVQTETTGAKLNNAIQRLSSGLRINNSSDDAAGLAIANKYRSDIAVIGQGVRNANDGLSTLQTIDGGLSNISTLLDRAAVLAAQGASDTFTGNRDTLQAEFSKVVSEITRQSQNIGLNANGVNAKALTTVIGGGTDSFSAVGSNQGVTTDLTAGAVDAASLKLDALNIGSSVGSVTGANVIGKLSATETLTFKTADALGGLSSHTVALTSGDNGTAVVKEINAASKAGGYDITASLDSGGKLVLEQRLLYGLVQRWRQQPAPAPASARQPMMSKLTERPTMFHWR